MINQVGLVAPLLKQFGGGTPPVTPTDEQISRNFSNSGGASCTIMAEALSELLAASGTVGTSEGAIYPVELSLRKVLIIKADDGNSADIFVGPVGNAVNGFILAAGKKTPPIYVESTHKLRVVSASGTQGFSWVAG